MFNFDYNSIVWTVDGRGNGMGTTLHCSGDAVSPHT